MVATTKFMAGAATAGLLLSQSLPLDGWEKLAVDAPLFAILAWTLIKTIPKISSDHKEAVSDLADKLEAAHERTNTMLREALSRQDEKK